MTKSPRHLSRLTSLICAATLAIAGLTVAVVAAPLAVADAAPPGVAPVVAPTPSTVTTDALPTAQINGVVWSQAVNAATGIVYAGGKFTAARPAGVAVGGSGTVTRNNLLAYSISTGVLVSSFAPSLDGQVLDVALSPDNSRLYVVGDFQHADGGVGRYRVAAYDTSTGALITTFAPAVSSTVNTVVATKNTVYIGGAFSAVNGSPRSNIAALSASNGALLAWNPSADAAVRTMVMAPANTALNTAANSKLIIGGRFQNVTPVGGVATGEYGMAALDANTGGLLKWAATGLVQNAGTQASITALRTDGTNVYGTGYVFGNGGNLEGTFQSDTDGNIIWVEDCHGDSYDTYPAADVVYTVSHAHYCGTIGGFPQSDPWSTNQRHALAYTKAIGGTVTHDALGYFDFGGNPSPSMVTWYPDFTIGSFTGQSQAAWSVTGNSQYVVMGGEFPTVNGVGQQGLVRFPAKTVQADKSAPVLAGTKFMPTVKSLTANTAHVAFQANWDKDDKTLTYKVLRSGGGANNVQVYTTTADSEYWNRPSLGFTDTGLTAGTTYSYRLYATDPAGNQTFGNLGSGTVSATGSLGDYANLVKDQGASTYWRLNEPSGGTTEYDYAGFNDGVVGATVARGTTGALIDSSDNTDAASAFDGTATSIVSAPQAIQGPNTFTTEAWFKTTTTTGGKILGFGSNQTTASSSYDRHIYMDPQGHINFGVYPNFSAIITSTKTYNDGGWHQFVASLGSNGMVLYVDGLEVASNSSITNGQSYQGYWRVGGDSSWNGDPYFRGSIDEVSIYPTVLTKDQVMAQYVASGRTSSMPAAPTDTYGKTVFNDSPDLFWRLSDNGGTAADSGPSLNPGLYQGGYLQGAQGAIPGTNTAVTFNGSDGFVASANQFNNPTTYSEEAWFKTATTSGGKIIGFGNANQGSSDSYDRHVYMQLDGTIAFGAYTGNLVVVQTSKPYNDNAWHYVVATQGSDGMHLYVDGQLADSNTNTLAQAYTGYWRIGGDTSWNGAPYFAGTIDEAAVYSTVLSPAAVQAHFQASGGQLANVLPTAAFTSTQKSLKASFDGSGSRDSDGTIASYAWNFGDSGTDPAVSPDHTYSANGTYTVTLTVTDDRGGSNTVTHQVTVTDAAPTASFTTTATDLTLAVDGSGSTDSDGSITSYAWDFGDSGMATGATASHAYATAGTYTVKLTVKDDFGATNTMTSSVTVTAPVPNKLPTAAFTSSTAGLSVTFDGAGSTDADGTISSYAWTFGDGTSATGPSPSNSYAAAGTYHVTLRVTDNDGGVGTVAKDVSVIAPDVSPVASFTSNATNLSVAFDGSGSHDSDGTIASYAWTFGDGQTSTSKMPTHVYGAGGAYAVTLKVTDDRGGSDSASTSITVAPAPPANVPPTAAFTGTPTDETAALDASASTDTDGSISKYSWAFGDGATATGKTTTHTYATPNTYAVTLTVVDNAGGTDSITKSVTTSAPNQAPTASFTSTTTNLMVAVDASTSKDPDGTISSYAWAFGDGGTATGPTASHTYTTAGTFTVTLTVKDNQGATGTKTASVTVAPAGPTVYASDQFGRTVAAGLGSADQGGSWTLTGAASLYTVGGGVGTIKAAIAGAGPQAFLPTITARDTDAQVAFSIDKAPTGGGFYVYLASRHIGNSDYRLKIQVPASGVATLTLVKVVNNTETVITTKAIAGLTVAVGDVVRLKLRVTGSGTTTLSGKAWKVGTTEPATWPLTGTDTQAELQAAGGIGLKAYLSGSSSNAPVTASFGNLLVQAITG